MNNKNIKLIEHGIPFYTENTHGREYGILYTAKNGNEYNIWLQFTYNIINDNEATLKIYVYDNNINLIFEDTEIVEVDYISPEFSYVKNMIEAITNMIDTNTIK